MVAMSLFSTFSQMTWSGCQRGPTQVAVHDGRRRKWYRALRNGCAVAYSALRVDEKQQQRQQARRCVTHGNAIGVLLTNTLGLGLALLKGVLVLELAPHIDGINRSMVKLDSVLVRSRGFDDESDVVEEEIGGLRQKGVQELL